MRRTLTITIDQEGDDCLLRVVGRRHIRRFVNDLARPHVVQNPLEDGYRAMAADQIRDREATEWIEGVVSDVADEPG